MFLKAKEMENGGGLMGKRNTFWSEEVLRSARGQGRCGRRQRPQTQFSAHRDSRSRSRSWQHSRSPAGLWTVLCYFVSLVCLASLCLPVIRLLLLCLMPFPPAHDALL